MSTDESFWTFSLRVYAEADVPSACLALQNDCGLDVNVLLYCCWLGVHGSVLTSEDLERALAFARPWSEQVVRPLRQVRTWMKHTSDTREQLPADAYAELRESIKAVELEAEKLEQFALEAMTDEQPGRPIGASEAARCVNINLERYIDGVGVPPATDVRVQLAKIVAASISGESSDD